MNLTPSQQQAVDTDSREVLIIAGAGSGKTRVLTKRVARLIHEGADPSEFMVLTFTRKAAGEMRGRIIAELGDDESAAVAVRGMMIGTFHSVALRILREHGDLLGYEAGKITVLESNIKATGDADILMAQVCKDLGYLKGKTGWKGGLSAKRVAKYRESYYATGGLDANVSGEHQAAWTHIFREYKSRLYNLNALDFGMILVECSRLLIHNCDVLNAHRRRITHVMVDELQDANTIQHYGFLELFAPPGGGDIGLFGDTNFFGVGDPRQTIYGFRGARPDLMTELHPDAEVINLRECFRCGTTIVGAANRLIAHNGESVAEPMIGATGRDGAIASMSGRTEGVMVEVAGSTEFHGYGWSDIAVLARSHRVLKRLAGVFRENEIPYHRVGAGFEVCDTEEFRQLHAALRLVVNPRDDMAFLRLLEPADMPTHQYAAIRERAARLEVSHFEAVIDLCGSGSKVDMTWLFWNIHSSLHPYDSIGTVKHSLHPVLPAWQSACDWFSSQCDGMTVAEALEWYALRDSQDDTASGQAVTLSTVHAAKGLEWPVVIMVNCNEGSFPSSRALADDGVDEERNLFYVGMTRAKERLVLHYRRPEDQSDWGERQDRSRFLMEAAPR